jgi:hypothetical protein
MSRMWREDDGVLSFEWTLACVLLVFGVVGGIAAIRDTLIDELGDMAAAVLSFDQSFSYAGIPDLGIPGAQYEDTLGQIVDCSRQSAPPAP